MRCLASTLCMAAGVGSVMQAQVLTPTYDVEIKRPFAMPDFVAMELGPDSIGMTQ